MSVLVEPVLVLNTHWIPIDTCTVRQAFTKLFAEKARIVDPSDCGVHDFESWIMLPVGSNDIIVPTVSGGFRIPEVIVLNSDGKHGRRRKIAFSRKNLSKRDNGTCQYCGKTAGEMTVEHVMPASRGGKGGWLNCVLACLPCNFKKGDRTPEEAGMPLRQKPFEPRWSPIFRVANSKQKESWGQFVGA